MKNVFYFPFIADESTLSVENIIVILPPQSIENSKTTRDRNYNFSFSFDTYNMR